MVVFLVRAFHAGLLDGLLGVAVGLSFIISMVHMVHSRSEAPISCFPTVEEILHHLGCLNPHKYTMGSKPYRFQLVQDFFHPPYGSEESDKSHGPVGTPASISDTSSVDTT